MVRSSALPDKLLQKGSFLLISILVSSIIIALVSLYMIQGGFSNKSTTGYRYDIDQAKETKILVDYKAIQTALESYRLSNGHYPDTLDQLIKVSLLSSLPKNPYTGLNYDYQGAENTYTLSTKRGNGEVFEITN